MFKSMVDLCKFSVGGFGNHILRSIFENVVKYSNMTIGCPGKKGFYEMENFRLLQSYFPQFWNNLRIKVSSKLLGKPDLKKRMILLCDISGILEIRKN